MAVSVGIPTTGERPTLRRTVETAIRSASLASQDADVLVVVNGRGDAPGLGRIDSPLLRVVHLKERNVSRARNCAIDRARHDVLLFTDDDGVVPESWCTELSTALRERSWAVVSAPVRVPVTGPVTALIDYQRIFDPPPAGPDEAHMLYGNCGLRRSLIPRHVRYDEDHLPAAAEDVGFSFALRAAGLRIGWLADAAPWLHSLQESLSEITGRGFRYGRGSARLHLVGRHQKMAVPRALSMYASMASGKYQEYRRFPEFISPGVRAAFTALDFMLNASMRVGYLDELGTELGCRLIDLDSDALNAAWREIYLRVLADVRDMSAGDWANLPTDYARLEQDPDSPGHDQAAAASVAAALGRHAPLTKDKPVADSLRMPNLEPSPGDPSSGPATAAAQTPAAGRLAAAWDSLPQDRGLIRRRDLERCIRSAGLPFRQGGLQLEAVLRARCPAGRPGST